MQNTQTTQADLTLTVSTFPPVARAEKKVTGPLDIHDCGVIIGSVVSEASESDADTCRSERETGECQPSDSGSAEVGDTPMAKDKNQTPAPAANDATLPGGQPVPSGTLSVIIPAPVALKKDGTPKGKPGRKTPMSKSEKDNMSVARTAAAAERNTLLVELLGDQAEKPGAWVKLGKECPQRLLAIRKIVDGVAKDALKARLAAAEAECERIRTETNAALASLVGEAAAAPVAPEAPAPAPVA